MLYNIVKIPAKIGIHLYCKSIRANNKSYFSHTGPLLIAANHPNSFLDAIILSTLFKKPVYSLTRGDAFSNPFFAKCLKSLNMLPVYRNSEGLNNLEINYSTFEKCNEIFAKNGIVLIFSEGRCINEWHLRPLRKGTARVAINAWENNINLKILPTGINYHSFTDFGKIIDINFGTPIDSSVIANEEIAAKKLLSVNNILSSQLNNLVYEIKKDDTTLRKKLFSIAIKPLYKLLLTPFAIMGYLLHFPLYIPIKKLAYAKALHYDHYDSVVVTLLMLLYPIYLLLIGVLIYTFASTKWLILLPIMPLCAWAFVQWKKTKF